VKRLQDQLPDLFALIDVPDELAALLDRMADLDGKSVVRVEVPSAPTLVARGMPVDKAHAEVAKAAAAAREAATAAETIGAARENVRRGIDKWVERHTNLLIEGPIRSKTTEVLDAAAEPAEVLARFAPAFDTKIISRKATAAELATWQASRPIADDFVTLCAGWSRLWRRYHVRPHHGRPGPAYNPKRLGGIHCWTDTTGLPRELTFGLWGNEVLNFAPHRDRFRLASPDELLPHTERHRLEQPPRSGIYLLKQTVRDPDIGEVRA